jgi:hypothetical protein
MNVEGGGELKFIFCLMMITQEQLHLNQSFPKVRRHPTRRALLVLWRFARCLYEGHIYFERSVGARQNIGYILVGTLLG